MQGSAFASTFSQELVFALDLCERAGKTAITYFDQSIEMVRKSDDTPVTQADKVVERMLREAIGIRFPEDSILGEEEPEKVSASVGEEPRRRWILDPIDGTFNFARGIPIFSVLLALEVGDDIAVGVVHNPANGDIFWAERGRGAFKNGERIWVSEISEVNSALFTFGGPNRIKNSSLWGAFCQAIDDTYRQRGFGDYLGFAYVFEGKAEAHLEVGVHPWDLAPMKVIVEEAGGAFHDLHGGSSIAHGSCVITNSLLSDEFKARFSLVEDS
ncbi:MAG: histidinol-phosphatase [Cyanobacteria bacterium]|nr:histidinol-phosphatase [Cyanobacteriota bacterium]